MISDSFWPSGSSRIPLAHRNRIPSVHSPGLSVPFLRERWGHDAHVLAVHVLMSFRSHKNLFRGSYLTESTSLDRGRYQLTIDGDFQLGTNTRCQE